MQEREIPAFSIDHTPLDGGRELTTISIESDGAFSHMLPQDWREQVSPVLEESQTTFVEYFKPELARTLGPVPMVGRMAMKYAELHMQVYEDVADMLAERDRGVKVADTANNMAFMAYDSLLPNSLMYVISNKRGKGVASHTPDSAEKMVPSPTDARRMLTAAAIRQEADRLPEGSSVAYIAAPAHVMRVRDYLTRPHDRWDRMRYAAYHKAMPGIDRTVRTYEPRHTPAGTDWVLRSRTPIK